MSCIERYDYAFDPQGSDWAARLLRRVPQGVPVLELGPGPGAMTRVLIRDEQRTVTVVEKDPQTVEILKSLPVKLVQADLDTDEWVRALGNERFGAILACDVLEHLRDPRQVVQTLGRLLQPSGCLVISIPNVAYAGVVAGLRSGEFDYADKGLLDRTHVHFFTRVSLEQMLMDCGLVPVVWEAYRLPPERSEFAHYWETLSGPWREYLSMGWPDYDVYEWMAVAVPTLDSREWSGELLRNDQRNLREELQELQRQHAQEHDSLLEHQKAFAEAKTVIADLQNQLVASRAHAQALQRGHGDFAASAVSWKTRLRRLLG